MTNMLQKIVAKFGFNVGAADFFSSSWPFSLFYVQLNVANCFQNVLISCLSRNRCHGAPPSSHALFSLIPSFFSCDLVKTNFRPLSLQAGGAFSMLRDMVRGISWCNRSAQQR